MAAVLQDAIGLYLKRTLPGTAKQRQNFQQAQRQTGRWLRSDDRTSVFSFLRICEALNLEPQYLRRGLRQLDDQAIPDARDPESWADIDATTQSGSRAAAS